MLNTDQKYFRWKTFKQVSNICCCYCKYFVDVVIRNPKDVQSMNDAKKRKAMYRWRAER